MGLGNLFKGFLKGTLKGLTGQLVFMLGSHITVSAFAKRPKLAIKHVDLGRNVSDPVGALPVIYGGSDPSLGPNRPNKVVVGLHRVYVTTNPTDEYKHLWIIGALGHGPIAGIDEVFPDAVLTRVPPASRADA